MLWTGEHGPQPVQAAYATPGEARLQLVVLRLQLVPLALRALPRAAHPLLLVLQLPLDAAHLQQREHQV